MLVEYTICLSLYSLEEILTTANPIRGLSFKQLSPSTHILAYSGSDQTIQIRQLKGKMRTELSFSSSEFLSTTRNIRSYDANNYFVTVTELGNIHRFDYLQELPHKKLISSIFLWSIEIEQDSSLVLGTGNDTLIQKFDIGSLTYLGSLNIGAIGYGLKILKEEQQVLGVFSFFSNEIEILDYSSNSGIKQFSFPTVWAKGHSIQRDPATGYVLAGSNNGEFVGFDWENDPSYSPPKFVYKEAGEFIRAISTYSEPGVYSFTYDSSEILVYNASKGEISQRIDLDAQDFTLLELETTGGGAYVGSTGLDNRVFLYSKCDLDQEIIYNDLCFNCSDQKVFKQNEEICLGNDIARYYNWTAGIDNLTINIEVVNFRDSSVAFTEEVRQLFRIKKSVSFDPEEAGIDYSLVSVSHGLNLTILIELENIKLEEETIVVYTANTLIHSSQGAQSPDLYLLNNSLNISNKKTEKAEDNTDPEKTHTQITEDSDFIPLTTMRIILSTIGTLATIKSTTAVCFSSCYDIELGFLNAIQMIKIFGLLLFFPVTFDQDTRDFLYWVDSIMRVGNFKSSLLVKTKDIDSSFFWKKINYFHHEKNIFRSNPIHCLVFLSIVVILRAVIMVLKSYCSEEKEKQEGKSDGKSLKRKLLAIKIGESLYSLAIELLYIELFFSSLFNIKGIFFKGQYFSYYFSKITSLFIINVILLHYLEFTRKSFHGKKNLSEFEIFFMETKFCKDALKQHASIRCLNPLIRIRNLVSIAIIVALQKWTMASLILITVVFSSSLIFIIACKVRAKRIFRSWVNFLAFIACEIVWCSFAFHIWLVNWKQGSIVKGQDPGKLVKVSAETLKIMILASVLIEVLDTIVNCVLKLVERCSVWRKNKRVNPLPPGKVMEVLESEEMRLRRMERDDQKKEQIASRIRSNILSNYLSEYRFRLPDEDKHKAERENLKRRMAIAFKINCRNSKKKIKIDSSKGIKAKRLFN